MLSRETLVSMLKNEYPSSYSAHDVDNMSVKELDDLLDYLDSMQNKANERKRTKPLETHKPAHKPCAAHKPAHKPCAQGFLCRMLSKPFD